MLFEKTYTREYERTYFQKTYCHSYLRPWPNVKMRIERVRIEKLNFIPMKNQRQNAAWHFNFFKSIYAACRCREKNKTFLFCLKTTSYSAFQDLFLLTGHVSYLPFGSPAQTIVFPSNPFSNVESVLNWSTQVSFLRMRIVAFNKTSLSLEPEIRKKNKNKNKT